jgi:hypothetical protein
MSYLLNLIRSATIEFFYLDIESTDLKKTTQTEYKNILNKEKICAFHFFNITLDFDFEIDLFPNVESLYFESIIFNSFASYSFISKCKKLNKLYFKKCTSKYLSALLNSSNIKLKTLIYDTPDIVDNVDISLITSLEELNIFNSNLTSIDNFEKLYNLKILNLQNNSLIRIDQIKNLKELRSLNITSNALVSIDEIEYLSNLEEINCSYNQIIKFWNFEKTPKIKKLIIASNNISNCNELIKLKNLEHFDITMNPIKSLPNLLLLLNLDYELIRIDWNLISSVEGVKGFGLIKNIIKNLTLNI